MMMVEERRRNSRVPFKVSVDLSFVDNSYGACPVGDLSIKGLFVSGVVDRAPGDECLVKLRLAGNLEDLALTGKVVRQAADGLAIHFEEMELDACTHLRQIVYFNSGEPDAVREDFTR
ncbi:MAG: PilZ domain-containing protein [Thermodesulfobacteriota bacterium]